MGNLIASIKAWILNYHKRIIAALVFVIVLILLFGCSATSRNIIPEDPGVGYSWWAEAPDWMSKDCIYGGYGLMDGITVHGDDGSMGYVIMMDAPNDGLDGECDTVVFLIDTGITHERSQGYTGKTLQVVGEGDCEAWNEIKAEFQIEA